MMTDTGTNRFIILGFPRSGTTLLSRLLDAHPEISCPPETHLFSAAGRFLKEQSAVEGPPIGVLTGLGFAGVPAEEVIAPLRDMIFAHQARIAGEKPVWVEKTGNDIFHLEALEPLMAGHMLFICLIRHPLDVIASNIDLAAKMGAELDDLHALTRGANGPHEGLARAWIARTEALDAFAERNAAATCSLRYEDLLKNPAGRLGDLFRFMGVTAKPDVVIERAFSGEPRVGLGDFRIHDTKGIASPVKDSWRKRLPPAALARIVPMLAPLMERHGYPVPKTPKQPGREDAIRQFQMAARMRQSTSGAG